MADHRPAMIKKFRALAYPVAAEVVALAAFLDKQLVTIHAELGASVFARVGLVPEITYR